MSPPKSCAVCGDKALGHNFNAVTCESCKAFFRRNALAKKQFTCPFNQNCEITVVTRRFCQKCRLKKCLDIGMKSENIMSEEDKLIKRRKIENNRAKRRLNEQRDKEDAEAGSGTSACSIKSEDKKSAAADSSGYDAFAVSYDSQQSFDSNTTSPGAVGGLQLNSPMSTTGVDHAQEVNSNLMTSEEMVEYIVADPDRASQAISKLFRTPKEAMTAMEKIISCQKDALKLIEHLIAYPGDALKIISKIMNSPFNALTVFTKFMSSPTDALEIISKIVSSPQDVLNFIRNLMDSPEDALDIMNKFMNTPAEALKILNKIFNGPDAPLSNTEDTSAQETAQNTQTNDLFLPATGTTAIDNQSPFQSPLMQQTPLNSPPGEMTLIQSMLNSSPSSSQTMLSSMTSPTQLAQSVTNLSGTTTPISSFETCSSPQAMSITSPLSIANSDMHYNSPTSLQHDELPSTSAGLLSTSPTNICGVVDDTDFSSEHFNIKSFIQNSFPDNSSTGEGINSLESVLSEVIRIEFQAFNNLPPEPRVKSEQYALHKQQQQQQQQYLLTQDQGATTYSGCNQNRQTFQQQQQQQQPICAPSSVMMGRDLNDMEQLKLRELKLASEALYYPVDNDLSVLMMVDDRIKPEDTNQDPKLLQVINLTAVAIKRLIKMAKKITAFRDMCQEDQVALLKGGCTEMMIMRSVMTYDDDRNTWKIPHTKENMSNIRAEVLKLAKGNVYEEHLKFIRTFDEKWRMDENIILIMCAIVLFSPSRPRVVHSDVIRLEQNSYYYLLRRYLESVYPGCEAKSAFIKLIQKISDVERLNQFIIGVYLNVNPAQVEPLLREIFDLKNH